RWRPGYFLGQMATLDPECHGCARADRERVRGRAAQPGPGWKDQRGIRGRESLAVDEEDLFATDHAPGAGWQPLQSDTHTSEAIKVRPLAAVLEGRPLETLWSGYGAIHLLQGHLTQLHEDHAPLRAEGCVRGAWGIADVASWPEVTVLVGEDALEDE